jgi:hypothetical protein
MADLVGHDCEHVLRIGWKGTTNGALLARAEEAGFEVFLTLDRGVPAQNELKGRKIGVYVLVPEGQGTQAVRALVGDVLRALETFTPGEVRVFSNRPPSSA